MGLTGISSGGSVHSNQYLRFYYPDREYTDPVTTVDGFYFYSGATQANTYFAAGSNAYADSVPMPDLGAIQSRSAFNTSTFTSAWSTLGLNSSTERSSVNLHVELKGGVYDLVTYRKSDGTLKAAVRDIPLPATGVMYFGMDVAGLKGTLDGQLTIACSGSIALSGSLQYVDDGGRTAFLNGIPADTSAEYKPNPDYTGDSALGIMAQGDIVYTTTAPTKMEHNAYFFTASGSFGVPSTSYPVKSTLRRLGGVAAKYDNIGAYTSGTTTTAGFPDRRYFFDENLVSNPPPHFLQIDQPVFAAYRQVRGAGRHAVSGEVSWNLRGVTIGLTPPLDVGELLDVGVEIGEGGIGAEVGVGGINVGVGIGGGSGINIDLGLGGR
jgi:hypothetical protein